MTGLSEPVWALVGLPDCPQQSTTTPREPARSGDEVDVVSRWRKMHAYTKRPGVTARIKRQIRRRERQAAKKLLLLD